MAKRKFEITERVYLECKKCKKILFTPRGAIRHMKATHGSVIGLDNVGRYFSVIMDPPRSVVRRIQEKKRYQEGYRKRQKAKKKNLASPVPVKNKPASIPAPPNKQTSDTINYKCNACGVVVGVKGSLGSHCVKKHGMNFSEIGCTETTEPTTNPKRKTHKKQFTPPVFDLPRIDKIVKAEIVEGGVLVTAQIKLPEDFLKSIMMPTLM